MVKTLVCFVAVTCVFAVLAQENATNTSAFPNVLGNAGAVVGAVQMQQLQSTQYAKTLLNVQSASAWLQVAQSWSLQVLAESKAAPAAVLLEEDDRVNSYKDDTLTQLEQVLKSNPQVASKNLEEMFPYVTLLPLLQVESQKTDSKQIELQGEHSLLLLAKLWHIQAANKLADTQRDHYQSKVQAMLLQAVGGQGSQLLSLSYYRNILRSVSSMITIQKQDAVNTWVIHDILETVVPGLSNNAKFVAALTTAQHHAMASLYMEALLDVQIQYIDMYIQSAVASAAQAGAAAAAAQAAPQFGSFLEEEATEKPFLPFMAFGGAYGNSPYIAQYLNYLRFYSKFLYLQATQSLFTASELDLTNIQSTDSNKSDKYEEYSRLLFSRVGIPALYQWAQINNMLAYYELYSLYASMYQPQFAQPQYPAQAPAQPQFAQAAAMTDLLQTDAPVTQAPQIENELSPVAVAPAPSSASVDPVASAPSNEVPSLIA